MNTTYDISYEEYCDFSLLLIADAAMSEEVLDALLARHDAEYPEYAAREKREADFRRGMTWEEYQAKLKADNPPESEIIIIGPQFKKDELFMSRGHQYRATKDSWWITAKESAEANTAHDANDSEGWHTKAVLV